MDRTHSFEHNLSCPKKRHCLKSFSGDSPAVNIKRKGTDGDEAKEKGKRDRPFPRNSAVTGLQFKPDSVHKTKFC